MLLRISNRNHSYSLTAIRWLAFKLEPPTLGEIVEACIIDPSREGVVDVDERGEIEDVLRILTSLVVIDVDGEFDNDDHRIKEATSSQLIDRRDNDGGHGVMFNPVSNYTRVRLAHFSVKEYLVLERIRSGKASTYRL